MHVLDLSGYGQYVAWEYEITLNGVGNSDWIIIPDTADNISVTVSFSGGASGKMQTTTDRIDEVKTGSPVAVDWPFGVLTETADETCSPVTAMRAVQILPGVMNVTIRVQ